MGRGLTNWATVLAIALVFCGMIFQISLVSAQDIPGSDNRVAIAPAHPLDQDISSQDVSSVTINQIDNSSYRNISAYVSVLDENGTPITGLTTADFFLDEDQTCVPAINVTPLSPSQIPISFGMLMDFSISMNASNIDTSKDALRYIINISSNEDKFAILKFYQYVEVVQNLTNEKAVLMRAIDNLPNTTYSGTSFYDAIYDGVTLLQNEEKRKVIIGFTDGDSNSDTHTLDEAIEHAKVQNIPVYSIGLGTSVKPDILSHISNQTGGRYYFAPNSSVIASIYAQISQTLGYQYLVTYDSCKTCDGTLRNLTIGVRYGNYTRTNSKTYYSPSICTETQYIIRTVSGQGGIIDPSGDIPVYRDHDINFTVNASDCYNILDVIINNSTHLGPKTSPYQYPFTNVRENQSIEAAFSQKSYVINSTAGQHGSISPQGLVTVPCGSDQVFIITPDSGFEVTDVCIDGVHYGPTSDVEFRRVGENHEMIVSFGQAGIAINSSSNFWGKVYPYGNRSYPAYSNQSFINQARPGAEIIDLAIDSNSTAITSYHTFTNLTQTHTIHVEGSPKPDQVHIFFNGTPNTGVVPFHVSFKDNSLGSPTLWYWRFGDGFTSNEQNPVHMYMVPGIYTVTLRATNEKTGGYGEWSRMIQAVNG